MKKQMYLGRIWTPAYDPTGNDNDAYVPEVWAEESLMILENNMVAANLVYRDFEDEIKDYGDVVNTRRPNSFTAVRKNDDDNVTNQAATATNVRVPLNQWFHTSFTIKDGELSKSFKNLVTEYLKPAAISIAQAIDEVVLMQQYQFLANVAGNLGSAPGKTELIELKELMSNNQCPLGGRVLIVNPNMEGDLLDNDSFTDADKVGDQGEAMQEGWLGRKFGFSSYMDQNAPSVISTPQVADVTSNAEAVGATTIEVTTPANFAVGQWVVIGGDDTPQRVTTVNVGDIVITPGLKRSVSAGASVSGYDLGAVNQAVAPTGYSAEYEKAIVVDGFTVAPVKGQLVTFNGSVNSEYGLMTGSGINALYLDRPLDAAVADNEVVGLGPEGNYGFAFHRNALALVTRPLAIAPSNMGANSAVASYNDLAIRVTMQYQGTQQGLLVTLDLLAGVAVLDENLGAVLLG